MQIFPKEFCDGGSAHPKAAYPERTPRHRNMRIYIQAYSGIRTHNSSVPELQDISALDRAAIETE